MPPTPFLVRRDKTKALATVQAPFALAPMLKYVQPLVSMGALARDDDFLDLLNPAKGSTAADHWALIAKVNAECGEYAAAEQCIDEALKLDPNHVRAIATKVAVLKENDEPAEARTWAARLKALKSGASTPDKATRAAIAEFDVAEWYAFVEHGFFERGWGNDLRLRKPFLSWAKKAHPSLAKQHQDVTALERLIIDEASANAIADFFSTLTRPMLVRALESIREDVVFAARGKKKAAAKALLAKIDEYLAH